MFFQYLNNYFNHCNMSYNIIKDKCWKLYTYLNPKNYKNDVKKKSMVVVYLSNQGESSIDVDENNLHTTMKKKVNLSILHLMKEKEITKATGQLFG